MQTPLAIKEHIEYSQHGIKRVDQFAWLKDKDDPRTIPYLEAENQYCEDVMSEHSSLREGLYQEMLGRIVENDQTVPYQIGDFWYYSRTEKGLSYRIYCRKHKSLDAEEEVLLDENQLAKEHEYFHLESFALNPSQTYLAWTQDTDGSEHFVLYVKDLTTGELDQYLIPDLKWSLAWGDDQTILYVKGDSAQRPYQIWKRKIHTPPTEDQLIWEDLDERFFLGVSRARNGKYVILEAESKTTSETKLLSTQNLDLEPFSVLKRVQGIEYSVSIGSHCIYIRSNENAVNFKLLVQKDDQLTELLAHDQKTLLESVSAFSKHLLLWERRNGLPRLRILNLKKQDIHQLSFPDDVYDLHPERNSNFESTQYRVGYSSPITPNSVLSYDLNSFEMKTLKIQPISQYKPEEYICERLWATASDGTKVPISIARRKDATGPIPTVLYAYGSYGYSYPASFRSTWVALLNRGFAIAIAHIRGGSDMGREWYDDGKLFKKKNSFTDFITCADFLVDSGYSYRKGLVITGGSAGGLLMGAVCNQRPDLAQACIAQVPFVDVINTMLDPDLPLTVIEYEEWGNPNEQKSFEYMLSYSPYENVSAQDYPHMMVTAGLNDPRVGYWEPAKWVAQLRDLKTDDHNLLLRTNMGAGHGGASGRYGYLEDLSWSFAFILTHVRLPEK